MSFTKVVLKGKPYALSRTASTMGRASHSQSCTQPARSFNIQLHVPMLLCAEGWVTNRYGGWQRASRSSTRSRVRAREREREKSEVNKLRLGHLYRQKEGKKHNRKRASEHQSIGQAVASASRFRAQLVIALESVLVPAQSCYRLSSFK